MKRATESVVSILESKDISIHALVKRATADENVSTVIQKDFNPRPREEGDQADICRLHTLSDFNPRPREEGDADNCGRNLELFHFNPRPREEGDSISCIVKPCL